VIKKKKLHSVYFVADLLIQRLFILVLNPKVKAAIELNTYNLKKNILSIRNMNKIRNSLCYKLTMTSEVLGYILLSKNIFLPLKYERIFKGLLHVKLVESSSVQRYKSHFKAFVVGILGFL
jgi:hypothetical protein